MDTDVVVVGAGMAGLYAIHRLREAGVACRGFEAGSDVGGTWYWNRYPGARCDVPSLEYSYSFSDGLQRDWKWTESMAAQPEIRDYLDHVADRFDLRRDISFDTRVLAATYDEPSATWRLETDRGDDVVCRFVIFATGCLSMPFVPDIPGLDDFAGTCVHTGRYPDDLDLTGQRVAVIGTGSSGVQTVTALGPIVEQLHVFQRTPAYTYKVRNVPLVDEARDFVTERSGEFRDRQRKSFAGFSMIGIPAGGDAGIGGLGPTEPRAKLLDLTDGEIEEYMDRYGFLCFFQWGDWPLDEAANAKAREVYRRLVHRTVDDPAVADALSPSDYPLGCKRPVFDTGYFEQYNRPNVHLVDLRRTPIDQVTADGIRTADGFVELDAIVLATGFDAMTGALDRVDVRGRDGTLLRDKWADGPKTYLGLQTAGFPNLFMVTGPGSPSVLSNMAVSIEQHVDWITGCICDLRDRDVATIEAAAHAEEAWVEQVNAIAGATMLTHETCRSWYLGANVPGKPRVFMPYVGGVGNYRAHCASVAENGYEGFELTAAPSP